MSTDLNGKRVTVAGLGHFGGGAAAARWLAAQGADVLVTDTATADSLSESVAALAGVPLRYALGGHRIEDFAQADLIVASPAIPPTSEYLQAARAAGVPITTEIRLFVQRCRAKRIVGITGTKGKSTTTALLGKMLGVLSWHGRPAHVPSHGRPARVQGGAKRRAGKHGQDAHATDHGRDAHATIAPVNVWVGGNLGVSLLDKLDEIQAEDVVVLELSSYMLHYLGEISWSPHVAVVTMVGTDHLAWHGSADAYLEAKRNIVRFQSEKDFAVVAASDKQSRDFGKLTRGTVIPYGKRANLPEAFAPLLPGRHNRDNERAAYAVAKRFGVYPDEAVKAVEDFAGLPHRLQLVHEAGGVRYYDDSIATIPEAAVVALKAFDAGTVHQIVGGFDKGLNLTPLIDALRERAKSALCIGALGPSIAGRVGEKATVFETLEKAIFFAKRQAAAGEVVLLSPGCASYDQFANFQKRGELFSELAKRD